MEIVEGHFDYDDFKLEYELLEGINNVRHSTEIFPKHTISSFKYKKVHTLK